MVLDKVVISLGGSRIIPGDVDYKFLTEFKKLILENKKTKFIVVTGGGTTARKYINASKNLKKDLKIQSQMGISITRLHAYFMMYLFGKPANETHPFSLKQVKNLLNKNQVVFCGALRYTTQPQTTDATAAQIASYLKCPFINLTNVDGIYNKNPKTNKDAKFIKQISWNDFNKIASKIKFSAGQHFVLDQKASNIILSRKIPTYIVGNLNDIKKIITEKNNFKGSLIQG
ncbi:MAG: UMP kinase [Candidatus Nanoarchaeia archaeon]|nr:UMP kinase [Candidatus Nanoarchaeia archaeon]MDD3993922.1 UMP kinase [Candidatus Nanoarchaeia archaeon]